MDCDSLIQMAECIFCKILSGNAEGRLVFKNETCSAFLDIHPINPGHILVVPNQHFSRMAELPREVAGKLFETATTIFQAVLKTNIACEGANFFLSDGEQAGQEVPHCHFHIVPRFSGDGVNVAVRKDQQTKLSAAEQDAIAREIRQILVRSNER